MNKPVEFLVTVKKTRLQYFGPFIVVVVAVGVVNVDTVVDVTMAICENQNGHRYDSKRRNQNFSAPKQET